MNRPPRRPLGADRPSVEEIAAANIQFAVREAFVKAALDDPFFRNEGEDRVAAGVVRQVHGSYLPHARRLEWREPDPRVVLVFTEAIGYGFLHVVSDPFRGVRYMQMWERAMEILRRDPWIENAFWDSINAAVHTVHVVPRLIA